MNIAPLRKAILKEALIVALFVGIFGGVVFFLSGMHDESMQKKNAILAEVQRTMDDKQKIEAQFSTVRENLPGFRESQSYAKAQGLFIDSQAVRDLFNQYQGKFALKKMAVEMQPIVDLSTDPKYTRKRFTATRSDIKVTIEALSDEDIFTMMQLLQRDLPGFVRIETFSLARKSDITKDALSTIRREGTYALITSEMTFDWYGMKSLDANSEFNRYVPVKQGAVSQ